MNLVETALDILRENTLLSLVNKTDSNPKKMDGKSPHAFRLIAKTEIELPVHGGKDWELKKFPKGTVLERLPGHLIRVGKPGSKFYTVGNDRKTFGQLKIGRDFDVDKKWNKKFTLA